MEVTRRQFLKMAGIASAGAVAAASAGSLLTGCSPLKEVDAFGPNGENLNDKELAMFFIPSRCEDDCDACITACHDNHNVPHHANKDHEIKWIWHAGDEEAVEHGTEFHHAFTEYAENDQLVERLHHKHFLVMCNHCSNPACVRVCPTQATFRRKDGVVLMDYHRCIGCRFCIAACPYGARSFNFKKPQKGLTDPVPNRNFPTRTKGVVEKCNFCSERNIHGVDLSKPIELPYCVDACITKRGGGHKNSALIFGDLNSEDFKKMILEIQHDENLIPLRRKEIAGTNPKVYYLV